jgi:hypothetical protein
MGVPIIVTRVGNLAAEKVIIIATPHGDERNAQRLTLWNQMKFTAEYSGNKLYYFIPSTSPTAYFADIRDFPQDLVDRNNQMVEGYSRGISNAEYGRLLMRLSEKGNKARNGGPNEDIPVYNTNRDCKDKNLISTGHMLRFLEGFSSRNRGEKVVFFIHGYDTTGAVFSKYTVNEKIPDDEQIPVVAEEDFNRAKNISLLVFQHTMRKRFYNKDGHNIDNNIAKLKEYLKLYAGEYLQYVPLGMRAFDIELMEDRLNEGRPAEHEWKIPPYNENRDIRKNNTPVFYSNDNGKEIISNSGELKNKFYDLVLRYWD